MPVSTLLDLSKRACIKNARAITDVGRFEYWKIRPILLHIESPDQLHQIELASPHIAYENAELWKALIARDIPNWHRKNYVPKDPKKWYKVYKKYRSEHEEDLRQDEAILRGQFSKLKKEKNENQSEVINKVLKLPRQAGIRSNARLKEREKANAVLAFNRGSKTKMKDGKSVLLRARREAREIAAMSKLSKPAAALPSNIGQVKQAPVGMVNEYKRGAQLATRILAPRKKPTCQATSTSSALKEREARLRAMQGGNAADKKRDGIGVVKENIIDSCDSENDEEPGAHLDVSDLEDLFGENGSPSPSHTSTLQQSNLLPQPIAGSSRIAPESPQSSSRLSTTRPEPKIGFPRPTAWVGGQVLDKPSDIHVSKTPSCTSKVQLPPSSRGNIMKEGSPPSALKSVMQKRKKEVDIFARPKKIVRRT